MPRLQQACRHYRAEQEGGHRSVGARILHNDVLAVANQVTGHPVRLQPENSGRRVPGPVPLWRIRKCDGYGAEANAQVRLGVLGDFGEGQSDLGQDTEPVRRAGSLPRPTRCPGIPRCAAVRRMRSVRIERDQ